jgi:hypothetical protein
VSSTCDVVLLCMLGMATAAARIMLLLQREEERCESSVGPHMCTYFGQRSLRSYEECFVDNLALARLAPVTKAVKT